MVDLNMIQFLLLRDLWFYVQYSFHISAAMDISCDSINIYRGTLLLDCIMNMHNNESLLPGQGSYMVWCCAIEGC